LRHCQDVGSPRGTLRRKAHELLVIIDQMNLQREDAIHSEDIEAAARRWAYRQPSHYKLRDPKKPEDTSSGPPRDGQVFWADCSGHAFRSIRVSSTSSPRRWNTRKVFR